MRRVPQAAAAGAPTQAHAGRASDAELLFPGDWWRALSNEPLAALIVDSFAGAFCDALLDGCLLALEEDEGWAPRRACLQPSASAPSLAGGLPRLDKPRAVLGSPQLARLGLRSLEAPDRPAAAAGFTQSGLSKDGLEAWNVRRYHACQPLDPYVRRIEQAAAIQRPRRRFPPAPGAPGDAGGPGDQRKFVWPMARSNCPEGWDETTRRRHVNVRRGSSAGLPPPPDAGGGDASLLTVGEDGKTSFPYSLALHKAFLESQSSSELRQKAVQVAPLRITTAGYH